MSPRHDDQSPRHRSQPRRDLSPEGEPAATPPVLELHAYPDAADLQDDLEMLEIERSLALLEGMSPDGAYMADLTLEIEATRAAYVGTSVVEIAVARASIAGANWG